MQLEIAELPLGQAGDAELRQCYEAQIVTHSADYPADPVLSYQVYTEQIRRLGCRYSVRGGCGRPGWTGRS